jgi:RinA family phage transcriptional activator
MTVRVWHKWSEQEVELIKALRSLPGLIKKRAACIDALELFFPGSTSKIREIPISGKGENSTEHKVHEMLDLRAQMRADIRKQDEVIERIYHLLDILEPEEHTVINEMYFQNKQVFQIAGNLHISERTVYRLRISAIKKLLKSWQSVSISLI